ncbi:lipocalin family protein [uncultured Alistipes sp.]|uniref:lipocalin family protein n=1 Tax=uncultured Alistipes sp. TaxID=538949 RepID=UPI00261CBF62|nr:lipocalin family protein [uncultured Alistipes sp.]
MKNKKLLWAVLAALGLAACGEREPRTFTGFITDATMNTVTVQDQSAESTYTFSTEEADRSEAHGLLVGAPVVVDYKGRLEEGAEAIKVATNPTYAEAVGRWMLYDPENPEFTMGIDIRIEGEAASIRSATLVYTGWELLDEAGKILLKGQSIGNGGSFDFSQTGIIAKDAAGNYTLTIEGTKIVYDKVPETDEVPEMEEPAGEDAAPEAEAAAEE